MGEAAAAAVAAETGSFVSLALFATLIAAFGGIASKQGLRHVALRFQPVLSALAHRALRAWLGTWFVCRLATLLRLRGQHSRLARAARVATDSGRSGAARRGAAGAAGAATLPLATLAHVPTSLHRCAPRRRGATFG